MRSKRNSFRENNPWDTWSAAKEHRFITMYSRAHGVHRPGWTTYGLSHYGRAFGRDGIKAHRLPRCRPLIGSAR